MKKIIRLRETENANKGITLIALVITIIILLILVAIGIASLTGENGILTKAKTGKEETLKSQALEELRIKIAEVQIEKKGEATLQDVVTAFQNDSENNYFISLEPITDIPSSIPDVTQANEIYVIYKNYQFKIENNLFVTFIGVYSNGTDNTNPSFPLSNPRYLLIEVNGYLEDSDGAVINELVIYNKNYEKVEYTILTDIVYDSITKGKPYYWQNSSYWSYENLNNQAYDYSSNAVGGKNCTLFLAGNDPTPNSWARFVIDLGQETEIGQIRMAVGGYDDLYPIYTRIPKELSVYSISNYIEQSEENSTYSKNVIERNNDGLTLISQKTFDENLLQPKWIEFMKDNGVTNLTSARYLIFEVNKYFENEDGAVLNELTLYDKYHEKINYHILNNLEYDSATNGKSYYWEHAYWNHTYLNNNAYAYSSNLVGNQNCTLFLYGNNTSPNSWARFMIDLNEEIDIRQIEIIVGGYDDNIVHSRTPKEVLAYRVNNFIDGLGENSTYSKNIATQNNDGLDFIGKKIFEEPLLEPNKFDMIQP